MGVDHQRATGPAAPGDARRRRGGASGRFSPDVPPSRSGRGSRAGWAPVMFLGPFGVLFALFFLLPIGYAIYESFFKVHVSGLGLGPSSTTTVFAGLAIYTHVFSDPSFRQGVGRVLLFGVVQIPVMLLFATILWSFLYLPGLSPVVAALHGAGFGTVNFLGVNSVLWSIANIVTWEYTGYNMLII